LYFFYHNDLKLNKLFKKPSTNGGQGAEPPTTYSYSTKSVCDAHNQQVPTRHPTIQAVNIVHLSTLKQ